MSFKKNINNYWDYLEQKYPTPKYVGQIKDIHIGTKKTNTVVTNCTCVPLRKYEIIQQIKENIKINQCPQSILNILN